MNYYKILVLAFLLSLGVVLAGCGDTGGDDPTDVPAVEMTEDADG